MVGQLPLEQPIGVRIPGGQLIIRFWVVYCGPGTSKEVFVHSTRFKLVCRGRLYGLVRDHLGCDAECGHVLLFANARRNRLKLLVYEASGL